MAERPILSVRLDPETIERLNDAAEERGQTASSLARHLIKQGVGAKPAPAGREDAVAYESQAGTVGGR
jgi:predicted transcriptional regulator